MNRPIDIESMQSSLDLLARHREQMQAPIVACIHKDGEIHITAYSDEVPDPPAFCRSISLLWSLKRGDSFDTYKCHEFPIELTHHKSRSTVTQGVPEKLIFTETNN